MSYYLDKQISARVDADVLKKVKENLEKENKGRWYNLNSVNKIINTALEEYSKKVF